MIIRTLVSWSRSGFVPRPFCKSFSFLYSFRPAVHHLSEMKTKQNMNDNKRRRRRRERERTEEEEEERERADINGVQLKQ